jgi:hypothetical protein
MGVIEQSTFFTIHKQCSRNVQLSCLHRIRNHVGLLTAQLGKHGLAWIFQKGNLTRDIPGCANRSSNDECTIDYEISKDLICQLPQLLRLFIVNPLAGVAVT